MIYGELCVGTVRDVTLGLRQITFDGNSPLDLLPAAPERHGRPLLPRGGRGGSLGVARAGRWFHRPARVGTRHSGGRPPTPNLAVHSSQDVPDADARPSRESPYAAAPSTPTYRPPHPGNTTTLAVVPPGPRQRT